MKLRHIAVALAMPSALSHARPRAQAATVPLRTALSCWPRRWCRRPAWTTPTQPMPMEERMQPALSAAGARRRSDRAAACSTTTQSTLGYVRQVVRTPHGKIELIVVLWRLVRLACASGGGADRSRSGIAGPAGRSRSTCRRSEYKTRADLAGTGERQRCRTIATIRDRAGAALIARRFRDHELGEADNFLVFADLYSVEAELIGASPSTLRNHLYAALLGSSYWVVTGASHGSMRTDSDDASASVERSPASADAAASPSWRRPRRPAAPRRGWCRR